MEKQFSVNLGVPKKLVLAFTSKRLRQAYVLAADPEGFCEHGPLQTGDHCEAIRVLNLE